MLSHLHVEVCGSAHTRSTASIQQDFEGQPRHETLCMCADPSVAVTWWNRKHQIVSGSRSEVQLTTDVRTARRALWYRHRRRRHRRRSRRRLRHRWVLSAKVEVEHLLGIGHALLSRPDLLRKRGARSSGRGKGRKGKERRD